MQAPLAYRLGQPVVHAAAQIPLGVHGHVDGRQQHDGGVAAARILTQTTGGLLAVQSGHSMVEQEQFVGVSAQRGRHGFVDGGMAIADGGDGHLPAGEDGGQEFAIGGIVVGHQHAHVGEQRTVGGDGDTRRRGGGGMVESQLHPEGRPRAIVAADTDAPAHEAHQLAGDGQAEPGTTMGAGGEAVELGEGLEDPLQLVWRNAGARVADLEYHAGEVHRECPTGFDRRRLGADDDLAAGGELHGIAGKVHQHLSHTTAIAANPRGKGRVEAADQLHAFGLGTRCEQFTHLFHDIRQAEGVGADIQMPGLDLREVEDVVDDFEE